MSERIQRYRRNKAQGELHGDLFHLLLSFGVGGLVVMAFAVADLGSAAGWLRLLAGAIFTGMGVGLYRGVVWLRWPAAAFLTLACVLLGLRIWRDGVSLNDIVPLCFCIFYIPYLVSPSTKELFERAHAPIEA